MTTTNKHIYTLNDCGCYVDGNRGIYAPDAIIRFAELHGFTHDVEQTPCGSPNNFYSYSDYEFVGELEDEADDYMNEYYMVHGAFWGRNENGDWGLWSTDEQD